MMSRREMLDWNLKTLNRKAEQKDPDGKHGEYTTMVRRATGRLWALFCAIESEPIKGLFSFQNRERAEMIRSFNDIACIIGFSSYRYLRGR